MKINLLRICWFCLPVSLIFILFTGCNSHESVKTLIPDKGKASVFKIKLEKAEIILTAKATADRLTTKDTLIFNDFEQPTEQFPAVVIDYHKTFQTLEGIGGAITDAAAETFYKMPSSAQEEILNAYFDSIKGNGYSLCRTHINSCDFSSESYSYAQTPGDTFLSGFSIEHDLKYRIPLIKKALEKTGQLKLFASPWSPPAWMKTNNDMLHGGKLKPEYLKVWAEYYIRFFEAYQKEGISFWGLTVQNEPQAVQRWESCIYSAEDELKFVRDFLGPRLQQSAYSQLKLMIWDHNRDIIFHRAKTILSDPEAANYVWGTAFHWYMGDHYDNVKLVHDAFPDKRLLFSEGCGYPFSPQEISNWYWGEKYAEAMIMDFNNFTCGWTDWNILLDETGGPNHVGNYCLAPVIADTKTGKVHYMNSYYYIGHFSKFIRPGAKRIACSSTSDDLLATAFINPDGRIAVIVLNKTDKLIDFNLCVDKRAITVNSPSHSIVTCRIF
jgi:glucosylceramidase